MQTEKNDDPALVSVALITFNGEAYIEEQVESILGQSYPHLELVISDDGSTDGTMALLARYADKPNVKVLRNEGEHGIHGNLENALRYARGEFVAISDQDDIWAENKIERLMANIGQCAAIFSDSDLIDQNGAGLGLSFCEWMGKPEIDIGKGYARLLIANCVSGHALLFRRELLEGVLPFAKEPMYDQQIALVAAATTGIAYISDRLVRHRQHESNANNQILERPDSPVPKRSRSLRRVRALRSNAAVLLRAWERLGWPVSERRRTRLAKIRSYSDLLIEAEQRRPVRVIDLRLFGLLLPMAKDLFYLSSSRRHWLFNLYKLCRL